MRLRELFEATDKTAVVAFGRMNPPTIGHEKLVNAIKKVPGDHFLFLSHTQNHKDNPLSFEQKQKFASAFFPGITIGDDSVRTPIDMMKKLEADGYTKIVYVAGSDRIDTFEKLLTQYNGKDYNFNSITVVNAGARDPDAEGAEGMSASKMRAAAERDNFEEFAQGVPVVELADELFQAVKAGMVKPVKVKKMKAEEFVGEKKHNKNKPVQPNPVAKNAMAAVGGGGFGSHKDKKAAMKRGEEKHKKDYSMVEAAKKPNATTRHLRDYPVSDKDVAKPVKKPEKKRPEQGVAEGLSKQFEIIYLDQSGERKRKIVSGTSKESVARQFKKQYKLEIEQVKQLQQGVAEAWDDNWGSMSKRDFKRKELEYELRNEPPNNIQVVINGKPWKVFAGRGRPDSAEEFNHLRKMQAWAASKSAATGKKWSVHLTGAPASK